jgi:anti-sigma factor (TIGR02949 family)
MNRRLDRTTCEEAFRRLDDYLDRRLTPDDLRLIDQHLQVCDACSREFTFEASVIKGVREKLRRVPAPADLIARISEQIARATDEQ